MVHDDVESRLRKLEQKVDSDLAFALKHGQTCDEERAAMNLKITELDNMIRGNGEPGIRTDTAIIKRDVEKLIQASEVREVRLASIERKIAIAVGALAAIQVVLKYYH